MEWLGDGHRCPFCHALHGAGELLCRDPELSERVSPYFYEWMALDIRVCAYLLACREPRLVKQPCDSGCVNGVDLWDDSNENPKRWEEDKDLVVDLELGPYHMWVKFY